MGDMDVEKQQREGGFKEVNEHDDARGGKVRKAVGGKVLAKKHGGHVAGVHGHKHMHKPHDKGAAHHHKGGHEHIHDLPKQESHGFQRYKAGGAVKKAAGGLMGVDPRTPRIGTRSRRLNPLKQSMKPGIRSSSITPMGGMTPPGALKKGGKV
jgi:hypothetical protein